MIRSGHGHWFRRAVWDEQYSEVLELLSEGLIGVTKGYIFYLSPRNASPLKSTGVAGRPAAQPVGFHSLLRARHKGALVRPIWSRTGCVHCERTSSSAHDTRYLSHRRRI